MCVNDCNEIFFLIVIFNESNRGRLLGTKVVEIVSNTVHARVDEEGGGRIRALLPSEMEIIVGRNLVRLESWVSRDWDELERSLISMYH